LNTDRCGAADECLIGDSSCMIPPMTGNGMSIALESAVMAAPILRDYSSGQLNWPQAVGSTSQSCEKLLRRRLTSAAWLQKLCFSRAGRMGLLCMLRTVPKALNAGFWLTR